MHIPIAIRLDDNGLLRKECPFCEQEYKTFPNDETSESQEKYYCPYCGTPAPENEQLTKDQVQHIEDLLDNEMTEIVNKSLGKMTKSFRNNKSINFNYKPMKKQEPRTQVESMDMKEVFFGCCNTSVFVSYPRTYKVMYCELCGSVNLTY